jgi:hypothetical protein
VKKLGVRFDGAKRDSGQSSRRFVIPALSCRERLEGTSTPVEQASSVDCQRVENPGNNERDVGKAFALELQMSRKVVWVGAVCGEGRWLSRSFALPGQRFGDVGWLCVGVGR